MNASIIDLRYKTSTILKALERRENVNILYHGKVKGMIIPVQKKTIKVSDHPFFGIAKSDKKSVKEVISHLREGRICDL